MRRKHDARRDEVEGIAQRLRGERPEASPLELDRVKTTAMSRARAATGGRRAGARRLAVAGLTVGTLFATSGGVLAWQGGGGTPTGNAANTQYGNNCDVGNGNGVGNGNNTGNGGNAGDNNGNCNENSFNNDNNTTTDNNTTNNYFGGTTINNTTVNNPAAASNVLGSTTKKLTTSLRRIRIHVHVPHGAKVSKVLVKVNGRRLKAVKGRKASGNIELSNLPCGSGATKVVVTITLSDGKTVSASHTYHLCT
jgi:hypothetical protein